MLRASWTVIVVIVATVVCGLPVAVLSLIVPRLSDWSMWSGRIWSRTILWATGARVTYEGLEHAQGVGPRIYIANHQSMVDIWAMIPVLPLSSRFLTKRELFRVPVLGFVLSSCGFIPIDRTNRAEALRSLGLAAERIRGGQSVVLFPEGTRSLDGRLSPFKKGAFHLALTAGVPVVPVSIRGSFEVLPPRRFLVRPGTVHVRFDPPIDLAGYGPTDHDRLRREVQAIIAHNVEGPDGPPSA